MYKDHRRTWLPAFLQGQANIVHLEILRTSKLVYQEGISALYNQHIRFDCAPEGVLAFFKDASPLALEDVTSIQICHIDGTELAQWSELCKFIQSSLRLKTLRIDLTNLEMMFFSGVPPRIAPSRTSLRIIPLDADNAESCLREQWVQDLLQIRGLDELFVRFSVAMRMGLQGDLVWLLMSKMMHSGPGLDRIEFRKRWLSGKDCWAGTVTTNRTTVDEKDESVLGH